MNNNTRYFECTVGKSSKFWLVYNNGDDGNQTQVHIRHGKIGKTGTHIVKEFNTAQEAQAYVNKQIKSKVSKSKGYVEKPMPDGMQLNEPPARIMAPPAPSVVLPNMSWSFGRRSYSTYDEFVAAATETINDMVAYGCNTAWTPNVLLPNSQNGVTVHHTCYWHDISDWSWEIPADPLDNGVTMGKLLWHTNEVSMALFNNADHVHFEGFVGPYAGNVYALNTGS